LPARSPHRRKLEAEIELIELEQKKIAAETTEARARLVRIWLSVLVSLALLAAAAIKGGFGLT
jgi:hypothetical protein